MNLYKKIANEGYEESASMTSRYCSRHGLSDVAVRVKRAYNRAAKRREEKLHLKEQCNED